MTIGESKGVLSVGESCRSASGRPRSCRRSALDRVSGDRDDGKDVFLGKLRRRVEDGGTAIAPRGVLRQRQW